MSALSGHIEYAIPVGTFSLVRDRGIEYSTSGHRKVKLLDQMRQALRSRHYSRRTEQIKLKRCKEILGIIEDQKGQTTQSAMWEELLFELTGIDPRICPVVANNLKRRLKNKDPDTVFNRIYGLGCVKEVSFVW